MGIVGLGGSMLRQVMSWLQDARRCLACGVFRLLECTNISPLQQEVQFDGSKVSDLLVFSQLYKGVIVV
jgi:hypothetical protein